jgi:plastocyanin
VALGTAVLLALPAFAWADQTITAGAGNRFTTPDVTMDQGEKVFFRNGDITGTQHNVTSDAAGPNGQPLFQSATISNGTTIVEGAQYLTTGTYTFVCTLHAPGMAGTLHVTANGTPQQRPGSGSPAADTTAPTVRVRLATAHQSSIRRSRKVTVSVSASEAVTISFKATARVHGKTTTIARGKAKLPAEGSTRRSLSLTSAGRKALNGKRAITVKVTARAVDAAGNVGKATRSKRYSP